MKNSVAKFIDKFIINKKKKNKRKQEKKLKPKE